MKKIISLFLAITTLICIIPLNANTTSSVFTDANGSEYYYTAAVSLASKGIIKGYPDGSFGADKTITRAETATIMCRMIGKESEVDTGAKGSYFTDVASDHWALGYINLATYEKIFSGDGNGRFRPEDKVSYQEIIKLVLCAAGYGDNIELDPEDWSSGYVNLANLIGITKGIIGKKGEAITRGDVALLCYNALAIKKSDEEKKEANLAKLAELNPDGNTSAFFDENDSLNVYVGKFYEKQVRTSANALSSLELVKDFIGIKNPKKELKYVKEYESGDSTIFVFNQMYEGIPVYGRTVSITLDSDNYTKALNSGFLSGIDVSTEAKITKDEAKAIVQKNYEGYKIQSGSLKQVIYSIDTEPFVAWAAEIENDFDGYNIIIDASSGEIVREFSTATMAKAEHKYYTTEDPSGNDIVADVTKKGDTYILEDPIRGIKTKQHKKLSSPSYEIDENSKGNVDKNNDGYDDFRLAATAHVYTGQVYDYYADPERFDFILTSGQNNNPAPINVIIPEYTDDFSELRVNASSWQTSSGKVFLSFGIGDKDFTGIDGKTHKVNFAESIDMVTHEFNHRVFASKSPELTKQYYGLTGSINEAYCDIMGNFAEAQIKRNGVPDWIMADMSFDGGCRNLKDPHAKETAASWGDKYAKNPEYKVKYQDPEKSGRDYFIQGSIYENSTIISHAAFLMWDKGIKDISRLEKLWFNSMDGYDASSDFWDVRYNVLAKAQLMGMTEDEIKIISDSFDEVGIVEHSKKMSFFVLRNSNEYTPVEDAAITIITYDVDESAERVKRDKTYLGTTDKNGFLGVNLQLFSEMTSMKIEASKEGYSSASKIIEADDTYFILLDKLDNTDPYLENLDLTNSPDVSQIEIKDNMSYVRIDKDKFVCEAPGTYYMYPKDPITDGSHLMYDMPQNLTEALARASVGNYDMTTYECKVKPSEPNLFTVVFSRNEYVILTMDSGSRRFPVNSLHVYKVGDSTVSIPANTTVAFRVCRDFSVDTSNAKGLFSLTGEELCTHALYDDSDTELYGKGTFERPVIFTAGQTVVFKTGKKPVKFTMPFRALSIRRDNLSAVGCQ